MDFQGFLKVSPLENPKDKPVETKCFPIWKS